MSGALDTSHAAYVTPEEFLARYDARLIADLVSDSDNSVPIDQLPGNSKLLAALADASGIVEAAVLSGGRYDSSDLASLSGNNRALLVRIVSDLAYLLLKDRRGYLLDDRAHHIMSRVDDWLKRLRNGEWIFSYESAKSAGARRAISGDGRLIRIRNPLSVDFAWRYFGIRAIYEQTR